MKEQNVIFTVRRPSGLLKKERTNERKTSVRGSAIMNSTLTQVPFATSTLIQESNESERFTGISTLCDNRQGQSNIWGQNSPDFGPVDSAHCGTRHLDVASKPGIQEKQENLTKMLHLISTPVDTVHFEAGI